MKKGVTDLNYELRAIERSPYRKMSDNCLGCGYMGRPSSQGISCSTCHLNYLKKGN